MTEIVAAIACKLEYPGTYLGEQAVPIQFTPGAAVGSTEEFSAEIGIEGSDGQDSGRGESGLPVSRSDG